MPPSEFWLHEAIEQAKDSALPILAEPIALEMGVETTDIVDAIAAALLTLTGGTLSEESMRAVLRPIAEPYAQSVGTDWTTVADAILGMLEWTAPDAANWAFDPWNDGRRVVRRPK